MKWAKNRPMKWAKNKHMIPHYETLKKAEIKNISYVYFLRPQCGHINIHLEQPLNIPFKQPLLGVITI